MRFFISHNSADKDAARTLAVLLVEQGEDVFFDEWNIAPGESIIEGIEGGLSTCEVFVLFWSEAAAASHWVGTELRAFLRQRVTDNGLRIVPLMVDGTQLPMLVAEYRGFDLSAVNLPSVAEQLTGHPSDVEIASRLRRRLNVINERNTDPGDHFRMVVCDSCGSDRLTRSSANDPIGDENYYFIHCEDCGAGDWTQ